MPNKNLLEPQEGEPSTKRSEEQESVFYGSSAAVAILTLNRPDVLNSFNREMALRLQSLLTRIGQDGQIRAVLLTGAGRAFCAGQDLAEAAPREGPLADVEEIVKQHYNPIIRQVRAIEKPFVCAVNGVAAGAGANLALACDLVLASEKASFLQAFAKIGLVPDSGGTYFLPRLVGSARATALMMLGDKLSAPQAAEWGLVHQICVPERLMDDAMALALRLAAAPTRALGLIKRAVNRSFENDLDSQLDLEAELQGIASRSEDYAEGVRAFLEKRPPNFQGR